MTTMQRGGGAMELARSRAEVAALMEKIEGLKEPERTKALRYLYRHDLYALLRYGLNRPDVSHPWIFARCREVQSEMNGVLDLWAREHYKSTIITFAGSIFRIIRSHGEEAPESREVTIGIFSHTKPIARAFLRQIKFELETNLQLQGLYPDIFYNEPHKLSPKWTEDSGIVVKRKSNPKEATVEAYGLVDGQPTSKHFVHLLYDDVVTLESVTSPDMMAKTTAAYEMSSNLGSDGGTFSMAGTIYHFADTYMQLRRRGAVKTRIYPCTVDGTENFEEENCVLQSPEYLKTKRRLQGPYTFGTQMLLNPKGDDAQSFKREWIKFDRVENTHGLNLYICVDPANEKRKHNDYTSMFVIAIDGQDNRIVVDFIRDRLNLTERTNMLFELHAKWSMMGGNGVKMVAYEQYGMQADIQHIENEQRRRNYRFPILAIGGSTPKPDRIKRLIPVAEQGRLILPHSRAYTGYDGITRDLVQVLIEEELLAFPVCEHDDMLDCLARIEDPKLILVRPKPGTEAQRFGAPNGGKVRVKTGSRRIERIKARSRRVGV